MDVVITYYFNFWCEYINHGCVPSCFILSGGLRVNVAMDVVINGASRTRFRIMSSVMIWGGGAATIVFTILQGAFYIGRKIFWREDARMLMEEVKEHQTYERKLTHKWVEANL